MLRLTQFNSDSRYVQAHLCVVHSGSRRCWFGGIKKTGTDRPGPRQRWPGRQKICLPGHRFHAWLAVV